MWLHHIAPEANPQPNPALTSVQAKKVDVRRAQFLYPEGDQIFFAGRRKYFHHWDLPSGTVQKTAGIQGRKEDHKSMERFRLSPCGRYMAIQGSSKKGGGIVSVISAASTQWVAEARLSAKGGVRDFQWWRNGEGMTILGQDGMVGEYSLTERRFLATWMDEGGVNALVLALGGRGGPDAFGEDAWVAIGSNSGMCTLYNRSFLLEDPVKERPEPTRTFENVISPVTVITFSPDGQLLAYGSLEKDTLKLVHVASQTVYRNWPTAQTPLGRVTAVAFGKDSDSLAVGNDRGKIRLWEIRR
jgi:WD40 repeat protein